MKKTFIYIVAATAAALALASCETVTIEKLSEDPPVIESISPESASAGEIVTVTGQHLSGVSKVEISGKEMPLYEKVSNERFSFKVTNDGVSGPVVVTNLYGKATSSQTFTYTFAVPEIIKSALAADIDMGGTLMIDGKNLTAVTAVFFTSEGYEAHEAQILLQNAKEIVVKVPYVEAGSAKITLSYNTSSGSTTSDVASAPSIGIIRYVPTVTTSTFPKTSVGSSVTINGTNLTRVEKVLIGGYEAVIGNKTETELSFSVPGANFKDGDNTTDVKIVFFDGHETVTLTESFNAYVPMVRYWQNMKTYGQGRDVEEFSSFFSPETGRVYGNNVWATELDPVSFKYQAGNCSAANKPAHADEYDSVAPYFFFSGVSAGALQINGPANSAGQLKNFYWFNNSANDYRITKANANCYGTPVLKFRYLNPENADEKALIDKVVGQQIEVIDEKSFPINTTDMTVAGVGVTSASGGIQSGVYCPDYKIPSGYSTNVTTIEKDIVLLVMYYNSNGSPTGSNFAENIKRLGFLHIKKINFRLYNNTVAPSSSDITFNCYWQKYDYDYSKL